MLAKRAAGLISASGGAGARLGRDDHMAGSSDWKVPPGVQPKPAGLPLRSRARAGRRGRRLARSVPPDAFTAETLGTERAGNGVLIRGRPRADHRLSRHRGRAVWLILGDGRAVRATSSATTRRPASAWCRRSAGSTCRRCRSAIRAGRRPRRARRGRAAPAGAPRSVAARIVAQAGIRRLLGVRARRGDLHRAGPSATGAAPR